MTASNEKYLWNDIVGEMKRAYFGVALYQTAWHALHSDKTSLGQALAIVLDDPHSYRHHFTIQSLGQRIHKRAEEQDDQDSGSAKVLYRLANSVSGAGRFLEAESIALATALDCEKAMWSPNNLERLRAYLKNEPDKALARSRALFDGRRRLTYQERAALENEPYEVA